MYRDLYSDLSNLIVALYPLLPTLSIGLYVIILKTFNFNMFYLFFFYQYKKDAFGVFSV